VSRRSGRVNSIPTWPWPAGRVRRFPLWAITAAREPARASCLVMVSLWSPLQRFPSILYPALPCLPFLGIGSIKCSSSPGSASLPRAASSFAFYFACPSCVSSLSDHCACRRLWDRPVLRRPDRCLGRRACVDANYVSDAGSMARRWSWTHNHSVLVDRRWSCVRYFNVPSSAYDSHPGCHLLTPVAPRRCVVWQRDSPRLHASYVRATERAGGLAVLLHARIGCVRTCGVAKSQPDGVTVLHRPLPAAFGALPARRRCRTSQRSRWRQAVGADVTHRACALSAGRVGDRPCCPRPALDLVTRAHQLLLHSFQLHRPLFLQDSSRNCDARTALLHRRLLPPIA